MIDIHTHILFGVDDGAKTIQQSIDMIKAASKQGVKAVFLTPHIAPLRGYTTTKQVLTDRFNQLSKEVSKLNIPIKLFLGAEVDEQDRLSEVIGQSHTINNTNYVLIDFGMRESDISEVCYTLNVKGYKVIVAHPERYSNITFDMLVHLKKEGALFQVSAQHLIKRGSRRARKIAIKMLKYDLIDFVASDAHRFEHFKTMKEAYDCVRKRKGKMKANELFIKNPHKLV